MARPQTRRYRLAKLVRRNRVVFGAAALAVVGLLGGFSVATVLFLREKAARAQAETARAAEAVLRERSENRVRVSQAAVRILHDDMEGADGLIDAIPVEDTPPSLEAVDVYRRFADWHLRAGRMDMVARRFQAMAHALASVGKTDTDAVSRYLLPAGTAICLTGDAARYEWFRRLATDRFADTEQPVVAEQVLKACLLRPADERILARLRPLAEVVEAGLADDESRTGAEPEYYRSGTGCSDPVCPCRRIRSRSAGVAAIRSRRAATPAVPSR